MSARDMFSNLRVEIAELIAAGAMEALAAAPTVDPVFAVIAEHCAALAEMTDEPDEQTFTRLSWIEKAAREKLMPFVPTTLTGLQAKLAYTLAFSLPAWRESEPEDEPIELLESAYEALTKLLG